MPLRPSPDPTGPGQESVWDYPRPPALEPTGRLLRVELAGAVVAESRRGFRVLETSHPPAYYLPPVDCDEERFGPAPGSSFCEWKGSATYWTVSSGDRKVERGAWSYAGPSPSFVAITDHRSFYPGLFDCFVDDEPVRPQPGGFYGGWVTDDVVGPFKGGPGSAGW